RSRVADHIGLPATIGTGSSRRSSPRRSARAAEGPSRLASRCGSAGSVLATADGPLSHAATHSSTAPAESAFPHATILASLVLELCEQIKNIYVRLSSGLACLKGGAGSDRRK